MSSLPELKRRLGEIDDLNRTSMLLAWDQETKMPRAGADARAEHSATLKRLLHERLIDDELGRLLDAAERETAALPEDAVDAAVVRVVRHDRGKALRVPPELRAEIARAGGRGWRAWLEAREALDYGILLPHLRHQLELKRRLVDCFDVDGDPYDVLLDDYEQGMTTAEVEAIFDRLKEELVPLIAAVGTTDGDVPFLKGDFPVERQRALALGLLERLGFDGESWRFDGTVHPFAAAPSRLDIRITTNFHPDSIGGLFATIHEFGHGLYQHQIDPALDRTLVGTGASSALHESQSRLWENLVGRSRPFWGWFYGRLQDEFPDAFGGVELDEFYRAINRVQPSLIRGDADEATYNLHIILRFELERELLSGTLDVRDLPEAFDARMQSYLGLTPPDVKRGVLQDVHWSDLTFGYFPTYSLGNVISVQIWERAAADLPELDEQLECGEFAPLREWLRENLHRHGRKLTPQETLERAVGSAIDPEPYLRYLKRKLGDVAGVTVT